MNKLERFLKLVSANNLDIDVKYLYSENEEFNELEENVMQYIQESEIIYYSKAMAYLSDNDNSLYQSLEIASEMGITTQNLNSELLATLLYQQNLTNQWYEISEQVEEIFND